MYAKSLHHFARLLMGECACWKAGFSRFEQNLYLPDCNNTTSRCLFCASRTPRHSSIKKKTQTNQIERYNNKKRKLQGKAFWVKYFFKEITVLQLNTHWSTEVNFSL